MDAASLRGREFINMLSVDTLEKYVLADEFDIIKIREVKRDEIEKVEKTLSDYIKLAAAIENIYAGDYRDINFTLHSAGQALSTPLSLLNKPPFLYFDLGVSEGEKTLTDHHI